MCWVYSNPEDFRIGAREFLTERLALDQRVYYVAPGGLQMPAEDLPGLDGLPGRCGAARGTWLPWTLPTR